jgi:predicted flap endonuclease-1-like 5' DNA nuclease
MGLLEKLKSLFGSDGSDPPPGRDDPDATVEQAPDVTVEHEPDAASEHAVKGTAEEPEPRNRVDTGSTAAETESPADPQASPEDRAESPDETSTGTEPEESTDKAEPADTAPEESTDEAEPADTEPEESTDEAEPSPPVEEIKGIGPTYSDRLADVGIETVTDLAGADAEDVAEAADTSLSRAENWIDRASTH